MVWPMSMNNNDFGVESSFTKITSSHKKDRKKEKTSWTVLKATLFCKLSVSLNIWN